MPEIDFISALHKKTRRNYVERMVETDKVACALEAKKYEKNYWDGDRKFGYGGHYYDGRWEPVARSLIEHYGLRDGDSVLDVGCGKGFLLYEMKKILPRLNVQGLDISRYAIDHAKEEVRPFLKEGHARKLPYPDRSFDLVLSIVVFHNLPIWDLEKARKEVERGGRGNGYIVVESYRSEQELFNLQCWALTCKSFFSPEEWKWLYDHFGYPGDYSFIFFE